MWRLSHAQGARTLRGIGTLGRFAALGVGRAKGLTVPSVHVAKQSEHKTPRAHVQADEFRFVTTVPVNGRRDSALDRALEETFPASDPVSITISEVVRVKSVG